MTARCVVVWATAGIGSIAVRTIHRRPNLDLVGVWVHSEDNVGRDAGELANGEPISLKATNDADALIALKPDCVVYAASGPECDALAIPTTSACSKPASTSSRPSNHAAGQPARLRTRTVARSTRRRRQTRPGIPVRVGNRARLCRRLPAAGAVHPVVDDREDSRLRDRGCTTTTVCPTS